MTKEALPQDKTLLIEELNKLSRDLFSTRFAIASQQDSNTSKLKLIRRKIARVKTALSAI